MWAACLSNGLTACNKSVACRVAGEEGKGKDEERMKREKILPSPSRAHFLRPAMQAINPKHV